MSLRARLGQLRQSPLEQRHFSALLILIILPIVWWTPLLTGRLPDFMDTIAHGYPLRMAVAAQLADGTLPLWMPNIFSGMPLAANPQLAVWYPPQIIFYLMPGAFAYGLLCVLHYVWGGWGAYFFVRRTTGSILAGLFAAITFQFSAMLVSRIALLPHVYTTVWVPWMFLGVERAITEPGFLPKRGAAIVALCFGMQLLAGAPQITYYTALALPIYWLARAGLTAGRGNAVKLIGQAACQGIGAAVIGVLIAGIQLIPTIELLRLTERAAIDLGRLKEQALNGGYLWRALVGFTGDAIEDTDSINAIGIGAILFAFAALFRREGRRVAVPLWIIGCVGYLLSVGPLVSLWAKVLPLYDNFHAPRRALIFWTIAGSLASGVGVATMRSYWVGKRLPRWGFIIVVALMSAGTWWMLFRLERVFCAPSPRYDVEERVRRVMGDERFLVLDPTFRYSYDSRRDDFGRSLVANVSPLHGLHAVNGYDPLVLERYGLARDLACRNSGVFYPSHGVYFSDPNSNVLRLLGVQYLVGRHDLYDPSRVIPNTGIDHKLIDDSVEPVISDEYWPVWKYKEERPVAWAVRRLVPAENAEEALGAAMNVNPYEIAFNEEELSLISNEIPTVSIIQADARTYEVVLEGNTCGAFVCAAIPWVPGWKARDDSGEELVTIAADGVITGVVVPEGVASFRLRYEPSSFLTGALLSLAGVVLIVLSARCSVLGGKRASRVN